MWVGGCFHELVGGVVLFDFTRPNVRAVQFNVQAGKLVWVDNTEW